MNKKHSRTVVYILGAGFSRGVGHSAKHGATKVWMPLQHDLMEVLSYFNYRQLHKIDEVAKEIRRYFNPKGYRTTRGLGSRRHEDLFDLSVEEIITFFDELITTGHPEKEKIKIISRQLLELTTELISFLSTNGNPGQNKLLKNFVEKHVAQTDVIITFNWDTILDRVLSNRGKDTNWHRAWGYGKTVKKLFKFVARQSPKCPKKYPRLLKLHGSANWVAIKENGALRGAIIKSWGIEKDYQDVVMMPPKMIKREIWRQNIGKEESNRSDDDLHGNEAIKAFYPDLWQEAEDQLIRCKKIVFIGYSFPPADYAVANMLRRALSIIKTTTQQSPQIYIVDPNVSRLAERFQSSFKLIVPEENRFLSLKSYLSSKR